VFILPGDLVRLSGTALRRMETRTRGAQAAIAPDRAGSGTNALMLPAASRFRFAYGAASFARHVDSMGMHGWKVAVLDDAQLRFDLDTPQDLDAWASACRRGPGRDRMV
jgi:2-phospho-L-lactate guanylyltransferase